MKKIEVVNKSVSFNVADDTQKELHKHSMSKSNFSQYIKSLIHSDLLLNNADDNITWYDFVKAAHHMRYTPSEILQLVQELEYSDYVSESNSLAE